MALEEHGRDLDELLEEAEKEIKAHMESWENCFVEEKEDSSREISWINYLKEPEEQKTRAAVEQAASQNRDAADSRGVADKSPALSGKRTAFASLSQGRPPSRKKPCVILSIAGEAEASGEEPRDESGSPSSSSEEEEEEEAAILLRKTPKRNLWYRASGTGKTRTGNPQDRSEQLQQCRQKVSRRCRGNPQEPAADQSSEKPETPSAGKRQPLSYNLRRQSKQVSYVSQQEEEEEEEKSLSEGNSEKDWLPEEEESHAEEGEDTEETGVEEAEREEEAEAVAGPARAEPRTKNHPKTVRSYRCPECDREFSNSSNLQKHLLVHRGERPYGCHVCGKSYAHPSNLTKHQAVHTGERLHPCPTCPKAFYVKNLLDAHMRRHQGIRPFPCLECPSTFCSRIDLVAHMNIHVKGKAYHRRPLKCLDCDKTFAGPKLLRRHRKRHRNLVCEDCGQVFAFKAKYKFHRRMHATCTRCGVNYVGLHLCQGLAQDAEQPERVARKSSTSVPHGVVAGQPAGRVAPAGSQKRPVGSTRAVTWSSGTDGTSVSASSQLSTNGPVRPSDPAYTTSLKEPSRLGTSQRNTPLIPVPPPILDHRRTEPSTPSQMPLQLTPAGVPVVWPVTLSPGVAHTPALPGSPGIVTLLPHSQASVALPVLAAAAPMISPLTGPQPQPLTVRIQVWPPQPSGSEPVSGAANNDLILRKPGALPAGTKTVLENRGQKIVGAQVCGVCWAKYVGTHRCRKFPRDPDPHCEPIPQMAVEEHRTELDEVFEETEREIKALMEFWENCFVDETEDSRPESPWISKWHLGDPLDLNDECLREDPSYNKERVEKEALEDYLKELEEQRARAAFEQAASQCRDAGNSGGVEDKSPALSGKLTACAEALASLSQGRPSTFNKPCVLLGAANEAETSCCQTLFSPFAHGPALPQPPGLATLLPHSQASVAFPFLAATLPMVVPQTDSHPGPVTVRIPMGLQQLSGSDPVSGAANKGLILLNPATLPPGTKIILEIPGQKIIPQITAKICAICQAKFVGTHRCKHSSKIQ